LKHHYEEIYVLWELFLTTKPSPKAFGTRS
jgi:hypothetical protein